MGFPRLKSTFRHLGMKMTRLISSQVYLAWRYETMNQITLFLERETENAMRSAAKTAGVSLSRWVRGLIREETRDRWPSAVVELAGAWADFRTLSAASESPRSRSLEPDHRGLSERPERARISGSTPVGPSRSRSRAVLCVSPRSNNSGAAWISASIWSFASAARSPHPSRGKGFEAPRPQGDKPRVEFGDTRMISAAYGSDALRDLDLEPLTLLGFPSRSMTLAAELFPPTQLR